MTFQPKTAAAAAAYARRGNRNKATQLSMFLGSDGGILGVGAPEVATILLVGYFVLGPTELFKLTKEIGKFIQNIRTLGTEASKSFESTMENQLELQELRKAQSELTNAFSFRRSINVDQEAEAFSELPPIAATKEEAAIGAAAATTGASATAATGKDTEAPAPIQKKKKKRRVKKKVVVPEESSVEMGEIPDLDMSAAFQDEFMQGMGTGMQEQGRGGEEGGGGDVDVGVGTSQSTADVEADAAARLRKERIQRLEAAQSRAEATSPLSSEQFAMGEDTAAAQSRFEAQLSGKWNQQILNNEEKLSPLAQVMERLAILEEERLAANVRLDEEFARRAQVEEKFYQEKRMVLEQAAAQISAEAYSNFNPDENDGEVSDTISSTTTTQSTTVTETSKETEKVANNAYFNGMNSNENK